MQTHTVFTLLDGSKHNSLKDAKNHCEENMGAELRGFVDDTIFKGSLYKQMLEIVANKKYDKAIFKYVEWRKELDELNSYTLEE